MSQREEFVRLSLVEGVNFSQLCRRFGISRKTGYKWRDRFVAQPDRSLEDHSRRPRASPGKTAAKTQNRVLQIRDAHPAWGGRKIRRRLLDLGHSEVPSASTIAAILKREGRLSDEESRKRKPLTRFEREHPNELWQVDFKGEFKLTSGSYCYPLTVLDDHSRFSLGIAACGNQKDRTVRKQFRRIFRQYGLPRAIYVDNGNPWAIGHGVTRYTKFSAWLLCQDIQVIFGRPYHPQGRGKLERFHRTLKLEVLQGRQLSSLAETQRHFDPWREVYNLERPHEALELGTPSQRYRLSDREYISRPRRWEYDDRFEVRRANGVGQFSFGGQTYRISEAFCDHAIGLSATASEGVWDVWFRGFTIARLDERSGKITRHQPRR